MGSHQTSSNGPAHQSPDHLNTSLSHTLGTGQASTMEGHNFIIGPPQLRQIVIETCRNVVGTRRYEHIQAAEWNSTIITTILSRLMHELENHQDKRFKLIVNSSIAQTIGPMGDTPGVTGTRGLHVANAAYWDPPFDGMFSHKYAADRDRDFDVIVSIVWLSHGTQENPPQEPEAPDGRPPQVVA